MKDKISNIKVNPERWGTLEKDIEELAISIEEIRQLNPVTLTEDYTLIAGLHRLEAVKLLGWTEVECTITDLEGPSSELTTEAKNILRGAEKPVSSAVLKKISKLPPEQQAEASSLLVSGDIKTVDEFPVKPHDTDTAEENPMATSRRSKPPPSWAWTTLQMRLAAM